MTAQRIETVAPPVLGDMGYSTMPTNLTGPERIAYRKGFDRADRAYLKANGGPTVVHDGDAPVPGTAAHRMLAQTLAEQGRAYRIARHDKCHAGGMSAVRSYLRKTGQTDRLAELAPAKAARKAADRKPRKLAAVPAVAPADVLAAGVESGRVVIVSVSDPAPDEIPAPMPPMTRAARKATRREIAAAMRAEGLRPEGEEWRKRCAAAGLPVDKIGADR